MIAGLVVGNVFLLFSNVLLIPLFINLLRVIQAHLASVVIGLCLVGAFSLNYSLFNVWIVLIFGVVGYLMHKHSYPSGPFILAVVLTPLAENYFRQSIMLSQGSWGIFVERPISLTLVLLMAAAIAIAIMNKQGMFKRGPANRAS
jgi:putative tricarboxylic transport membrane protein